MKDYEVWIVENTEGFVWSQKTAASCPEEAQKIVLDRLTNQGFHNIEIVSTEPEREIANV